MKKLLASLNIDIKGNNIIKIGHSWRFESTEPYFKRVNNG